MSNHEIEDTVEGSVRALHGHDGGADLRDLFTGLFELQRRCDCSFTHGRVLPILVARRFAYRLPLASHPRYQANRVAFDAAPADELLFVAAGLEQHAAEQVVRLGQARRPGDRRPQPSIKTLSGLVVGLKFARNRATPRRRTV